MEAISTNLLIRSTQLTQGEVGNEYEFILDNQLNILKWVKLKRDRPQVFHPIDAGKMTLET